jgi:hypothetical protein
MATGANANININAVDNTRAAFLGVQRNLENVKQTAEKTTRGILNSLSGRGLGTALGAALGINLRNISDSVARTITGVSKEAESALQRIVDATGRMAATTEQRMRARRTDEEQIVILKQREAAQMQKINELEEISNRLTLQRTAGMNRLGYATERFKDIPKDLRTQEQITARIVEANADINDLVAERESLERNVTRAAQQLQERYERARDAAAFRSSSLSVNERIEALRAEQGRLMAELAKTDDKEARIKIYDKQTANERALAAAIKERGQAAREASRILSEGFEDAVFSGKKLSDVIKQLGLDLMRLMFRRMITNPLANFFEGGFSKILGFANGGRPPVGRPSIVGERGPELFVPSTAGTIIPNHQLSGGSSGSTYYIDARGADQTGLARLEAMIRQTQAAIVPMALGAMQDARARGGAFAV